MLTVGLDSLTRSTTTAQVAGTTAATRAFVMTVGAVTTGLEEEVVRVDEDLLTEALEDRDRPAV